MFIKLLSFICGLLLGFALLSGSSVIDLYWFSLPSEFSKIVVMLITLFHSKIHGLYHRKNKNNLREIAL